MDGRGNGEESTRDPVRLVDAAVDVVPLLVREILEAGLRDLGVAAARLLLLNLPFLSQAPFDVGLSRNEHVAGAIAECGDGR